MRAAGGSGEIIVADELDGGASFRKGCEKEAHRQPVFCYRLTLIGYYKDEYENSFVLIRNHLDGSNSVRYRPATTTDGRKEIGAVNRETNFY